MKARVVSNSETVYAMPRYPSCNDSNDEKKAIWNEEYDLHMKKVKN